LKVDDKTRRYLDDYQGKLKAARMKEGFNEEDDFAKIRLVLRQLIERREKGQDYRMIDIEKVRRMKPEELEALQKVSAEAEKANVVSREIKHFRDKEAQRETGTDKKDKKDESDEEKERKNKLERDREKEREQRRLEREEKEYKEKEREWENRERLKEREKDKDQNRREKNREILDQEYDDSERKRRSREYYRKKREREKEKAEDDAEHQREMQEEEFKRREEQRKEEIRRHEIETRHEPPPPPPKHHYPINPAPPVGSPPSQSNNSNGGDLSPLDRSKLSAFVLAPNTEKKISTNVPFKEEEEMDDLFTKKKRRLITLETALHEDNTRTGKLEAVKSVIEQIPIEKDKIFAFPMNWDLIDKHQIVETCMRPWVTKMISEYMGEEEKTLIDFIVNKIAVHTPPAQMLDLLKKVLDDEADTFIIKMWRRLIYEMLSTK